jgi:hypothetical protein
MRDRFATFWLELMHPRRLPVDEYNLTGNALFQRELNKERLRLPLIALFLLILLYTQLGF